MMATRLLLLLLLLSALGPLAGCALVPEAQLTECQLQSQTLSQQCDEQFAEIERLRDHTRKTEDRLLRTEQELALLQEQVGLDQRQLAYYRDERDDLNQQLLAIPSDSAPVSPRLTTRLEEISKQHPSLRFDPATGISKLDTDVLFDTGNADLTPAAEQMLADLVHILKSPEADDLKIMVAGHTDNRWIAAGTAQDQFSNNFQLSTARALAVADCLRRLGLPECRMAVAGFGPHQPVAPNVTPDDRQKNRRVEIFVMNSEVPVVGWTDSIPSLY